MEQMSATADRAAKDDRRREILDAAFAEFAAKGYAGVSMAAIARRARASKETLYAWFENKETLFNTLLMSRIEGMNRQLSASVDQDPSPATVLPIVAGHLIRLFLAIAPVSQAMGAGEPGDKVMRRVAETIQTERRKFADYLLDQRAAGALAFDDDPLELASLFVAMAEGEWSLRLATGMIDAVTETMIADHARRVSRIFLNGVAGPKTPC